ncbi:hypothetical protein SNE40_013552 [Patella caerulea]|uniref:Uncharacterized protein n=1 Tax=Patella caerulea TaxID=87958 RepID=A0AAN8JGD3_PATCE
MVCLTTDNGANITQAVSLHNYIRLQCFGHILNMAINNALKDQRIDKAVASFKEVVSAFSYSWRKKRELLKIQQKLHMPENCLISNCDTRWGSLQSMIGRYLEQEKAITQVLSSDRKSLSLIPKWQTVCVMVSINKALADFTDALSGEDLP